QPAMTADQWRTELLKFAPQLRAFSPRDFAPGQPEELNRLASGALVHAIRVVTDEIFYDELALAINNATVADAIGLLVLEELPPCYDHRYDSAFARAFLLASSMVATRLTSPDWRPPRTVAEALALQLFINEARVVLEATELLSWDGSEPLFAEFSRQAFAELNPAELYEVEVPVTAGGAESSARAKQARAGLRALGVAYKQWFIPRDGAAGMHPYLPFECPPSAGEERLGDRFRAPLPQRQRDQRGDRATGRQVSRHPVPAATAERDQRGGDERGEAAAQR